MERYYVIDVDGLVSWFSDDDNPDRDGAECFDNLKEAETRAEELAENSPDREVYLVKAIRKYVCPLGDIEATDF